MPHVVRAEVDSATGEVRELVDRAVLAKTTGYSVATIRKHCRPVEYDEVTGRAVYDRAAVLAQLEAAGVRPSAGDDRRDDNGRWR